MTTTTTTTANTNNTKVYVMLYAHSEYCGFTVYGGLFKTKESAMEEYAKRNTNSRYPLFETMKVEERNATYVILITQRNKDRVDQIKEDIEYFGGEYVTYNEGGYLLLEETI